MENKLNSIVHCIYIMVNKISKMIVLIDIVKVRFSVFQMQEQNGYKYLLNKEVNG